MKSHVDGYVHCGLRRNYKKLIGVESEHNEKTMHGIGNKCDTGDSASTKLTGVYDDDDDRILDEGNIGTSTKTARHVKLKQVISKNDKKDDDDQFLENLSDRGKSFAEELMGANLDHMAVDESDDVLIPNLRFADTFIGEMIMN